MLRVFFVCGKLHKKCVANFQTVYVQEQTFLEAKTEIQLKLILTNNLNLTVNTIQNCMQAMPFRYRVWFAQNIDLSDTVLANYCKWKLKQIQYFNICYSMKRDRIYFVTVYKLTYRYILCCKNLKNFLHNNCVLFKSFAYKLYKYSINSVLWSITIYYIKSDRMTDITPYI